MAEQSISALLVGLPLGQGGLRVGKIMTSDVFYFMSCKDKRPSAKRSSLLCLLRHDATGKSHTGV